MAARVETQHPVLLREHVHLVVPHVQIAGERMAEREPGAVGVASDVVMDVDVVGVNFHGGGGM